MRRFEIPTIYEINGFSENVFMTSGGNTEPITKNDARVNFNWFISDSGYLEVTNKYFEGKNGTVTLKISGILGLRTSTTLIFNGREYDIINNLVTITINDIKVGYRYPLAMDRGTISINNVQSNSAINDFKIEIVG